MFRYIEFLYKTGQWIKEEQKDICNQRAAKLLEFIEVLLCNIEESKKASVFMQLNAIAERSAQDELSNN